MADDNSKEMEAKLREQMEAEFAKRISDAVEKEVAGLKAKNAELLGKLKESSEAMKAFDGVDPAKYKAIMQRLEGDEETQMIAKGDINGIVERRTAKHREALERKVHEAEQKAMAEAKKAERFASRVLEAQVREAASKAGMFPYAVDDALFRARDIFSLDESGKAVQMREGTMVLGKDGKTPYSPAEWLDSMKETAPHWFPASGSGTGSPAGGRGPASPGSARVVSSDPTEFGRNLEDIASGKAVVRT